MLRALAAFLLAWLIALLITAALTAEEPDFTDSGVGCTTNCLD
jgi:hypothetical protein